MTFPPTTTCHRPPHRSLPTRAALALTLLTLLALIHPALASDPSPSNDGQQAFRRGDFAQAAANWEHALISFRAQDNASAEIATSLSLAAAYQQLGHHRSAVQLLETALARAEASRVSAPQPALKASLGAALTLTREMERAELVLAEALGAARAASDPRLEGQVLNHLGNLRAAEQRNAEALAAYDASATLARQTGDTLLGAQALGNAAAAATRSGDFDQAASLNAEALELVGSLAASHPKAFLLLGFGQTDQRLALAGAGPAAPFRLRAHRSFETALALAGELGNRTIETYALGYLAQLYEEDGQRAAALDLARRAVFAAQQAQVPEALYRWEWHTGRLLKAQGAAEPAIDAYRRAVRTLESIRSDVSLGYGNANPHRSFRDRHGPLFFELADLLLRQAASAVAPEREQALLREAQDTVEHLKTAELNDYFCDDCVDLQRSQTRRIEAVDARTAVIYLIPLPDRTELLVGLAGGLQRFTADVTAAELATQVSHLRRNLETRTTYGYLAQARQLYNWLIRPLRPLLAEHRVHTLVFVPDGALRTIPFASLHDGERFLIQELAVAVAPGLSLVEPHALGRGKMRLLLNGVSESVQGFAPLEFVPTELRTLGPLYQSDTLFNADFTLEQFRNRLDQEQYSIIHIASHGQFDRNVRNTFVLTYDTKLTLNLLESLIRPSQYRGRPVELLVLSACQTAAGDDRAALGLAGVAVKAGARSALATLWFVNDQSTSALVSEVYAQLRNDPTLSKARALQAAQLTLLKDRRYRHPCYWSPFLIIGNWL